MIFVVIGSNDISNTYFLIGARKMQFDLPSYIDFILNHASEFFKVHNSYPRHILRLSSYCKYLILDKLMKRMYVRNCIDLGHEE